MFFLKGVYEWVRFQLNLYRVIVFQQKWRKINSHNESTLSSIIPLEIVTVGKCSYGIINVKSYDNPQERLSIGNYVSIADNVYFILGGNHPISSFTNFPLNSKLIVLSPEKDSKTKGPIIIEDDVWIGFGSTILSGVTIGKGAIIAAGSVVVKNVPPFAIVAGNPAKVIKFRFSVDVIEIIKDLTLSDFDKKVLIENIDDFYKPLNMEQLLILKSFHN